MPVQFGTYTLNRKLAQGGMAELYLAKRAAFEGFEKLLVVKRIAPHLLGDPDLVRMFLNEARVVARLSHPNIVQIHDLGKVGDAYYMAMEYIHGEDLRSLAREADRKKIEIPIEVTIRALADACSGLHHAHMQKDKDGQPLGLVHRDVSPPNIVLTYQGHVKLVDFGIAKATALAAETVAGLLKGKYAYMSPEQSCGNPIDARTDVWAIGVLLWEFLCWKRLFRRSSEYATLRAVVEDPIERPRQARPELPEELDRIVMTALERDLDKRYPTAEALQAELEACARNLKLDTSWLRVGAFMSELFADSLAAQMESVRASGVGSVEELLLGADEQTVLPWLDARARKEGGPLASSEALPRVPAPAPPSRSPSKRGGSAPLSPPSSRTMLLSCLLLVVALFAAYVALP